MTLFFYLFHDPKTYVEIVNYQNNFLPFQACMYIDDSPLDVHRLK